MDVSSFINRKVVLRFVFVLVVIGVAVGGSFAYIAQKNSVKHIALLTTDYESIDLNDNKKGFFDALAQDGFVEGENVKVSRFVAASDVSFEVGFFDQFDAVFVQSGQALFALSGLLEGRVSAPPLVFSMMAHPYQTGLVSALQAGRGEYITGSRLWMNEMEYVSLFRKLFPNRNTVVFVHDNSRDSKAQLVYLRNIARLHDFSITEYAYPLGVSVDEIQRFDSENAIWYLGCGAFSQNVKRYESILEVAFIEEVPVVACGSEIVSHGASFSHVSNMYDLGFEAGQKMSAVLQGERAQDIAITSPVATDLLMNSGRIQSLGVEIPVSIQAQAATLFGGGV